MAPVNPLEILTAFAPYLTDTGGIKEQEDDAQYSHLFSIMRNCSTKLVTRCIYCKILKSTTNDVLDHFLKTGAWNLINVWVKSSKDDANIAFLMDLLNLLFDLPMTISRLRENECPKIVKKLCKHENEEIALKANQIIKKWTKIIHVYSEKTSDQNGGNTLSSTNVKDKKRKIESTSSTLPSTQQENSKKAKSISSVKVEPMNSGDSNSNPTAESLTLLNDVDPFEAFPRKDMSKFIVEKEVKRPVTVKVKPGKFRLDLSSSSGPQSKVKKKTDLKDFKGLETKKFPPNKLPTSGNGTIKIPAMKTSVTLAPLPAQTVPKDSISFIDALTVMPVVNVKKRRKINKECESTSINKLSLSQEAKVDQSDEARSSASNVSAVSFDSTNHEATSINSLGGGSGKLMPKVKDDPEESVNENSMIEAPKSPPRFSFYKDILEDTKSDEETKASIVHQSNDHSNKQDQFDEDIASTTNGDDSDLSRDTSENVNLPDVDPSKPKSITPKGILNYIKKGSKKSVRWPEDDSKLELVKFFELDETERINVTRPNQTDMKRFDMKHEAQLLMEAKKCTSYAPWKLIPIFLTPENVPVQKGINSKEREIQADLMKTTLECFYIQNQIPDSAREPELEFHNDSADLMKIIPLEDENTAEKTQDYSYMGQPAPVTGPPEHTPVVNYDYNSNPAPVTYNPEAQYNPNLSNNYAPPPTANQPPPQYSVPPQAPQPPVANPNYMPPPNPAPNYSYNNNSYNPNAPMPPNQPQPPMYSNPNPTLYPDYSMNNNPSAVGYGPPPPMNQTGPPPGSPPNMYNTPNPQPPNYYNQALPQPPQQQQPPPMSDNSYNNAYWSEAPNSNMPPSNNYAPPQGPQGGPPFHQGPMHPGHNQGPRFGGGRRGGRGGHGKMGGNDKVCRFYARFGKCKFDERCNFSHSLDPSRPPRY